MILFSSESNEVIHRLDFWDIILAEYLVDILALLIRMIKEYTISLPIDVFLETIHHTFSISEIFELSMLSHSELAEKFILVFSKSICPALKPSVELIPPEPHKLRVEEGGS